MRKTITLTLAALATTGAMISAPLMAQQNAATPTPAVVTTPMTNKTHAEMPPRSEWMNIKQAYDAIEKAGYVDIRSISSSRHGYKARAYNSNNERVRLYVNPTDGTVTVKERRNKDKDEHHKSGRHDHN